MVRRWLNGSLRPGKVRHGFDVVGHKEAQRLRCRVPEQLVSLLAAQLGVSLHAVSGAFHKIHRLRIGAGEPGVFGTYKKGRSFSYKKAVPPGR